MTTPNENNILRLSTTPVDLSTLPLYSNLDIWKLTNRVDLNDLPEGNIERPKTFYIGMDVDTEFTSKRIGKMSAVKYIQNILDKPNITLTVQARLFQEDKSFKGYIFAHEDSPHLGKYFQMRKHPLVLMDVLENMGFEVFLHEDHPQVEHNLAVVLAAYFGVAEAARIDNPEYYENITKHHLYSPGGDGSYLTLGSRLKFEMDNGFGSNEMAKIKGYVLEINGHKFNLCTIWVDTCGTATSYKDFAAISNTVLEFKDNLTTRQKENMGQTILDDIETFTQYALGDLRIFEMLENLDNLVEETIYKPKGLTKTGAIPLTTGSLVKDFVFEALKQRLEPHYDNAIPNFSNEQMINFNKVLGITAEVVDGIILKRPSLKAVLNALLSPGNSSEYAVLVNTTAYSNAKVDGGRAFNELPTMLRRVGMMADSDIAAAYGEGQRFQPFPIGIPKLVHMDNGKRSVNEKKSLYKLLKELKVKINLRSGVIEDWGLLVPGLFQMRISSKGLKFLNNFFGSFKPTASLKRLTDCDKLKGASGNARDEIEWNLKNSGDYVVVEDTLLNSILTSFSLVAIVGQVMTESERIKFLNNTYIETLLFYPANSQVSDLSELLWKIADFKGENTVKFKETEYGLEVISSNRNCSFWYSDTLGNFYIEDFLIRRSTAKLVHGKKSAQELLYKLFINTSYGDIVCPYFAIGNVVVGNNITDLCRCKAYLMSMTLKSSNTITDGGANDCLDVRHNNSPEHKPGMTGYTLLSRSNNLKTVKKLNNKYNISTAPLTGFSDKYKSYNLDDDGNVTTKVIKLYDKVTGSYLGETVEGTRHIEVEIDGVLRTFAGYEIASELHPIVESRQMKHLQKEYPLIPFLVNPTKAIKVAIYNPTKHTPQFILDHSGKVVSSTNSKGELVETLTYFTDRIGEFGIELKDIFDEIVTQGATNYAFYKNGVMVSFGTFRSYQPRKKHLDLDGNIAEFPPSNLANQIRNNPHRVERQKVLLLPAIMKVNEYKKQAFKPASVDEVRPGYSYEEAMLMRECSLSQFHYKNLEQRDAWIKKGSQLKIKYGQHFEMFYLNDDGTLDFQEMVEDLQKQIGAGQLPLEAYKGNPNLNRLYSKHPQFDELQVIKANLKIAYTMGDDLTEFIELDEDGLEVFV